MTEELHSYKYDGEYEEEEDDGDGHCQEVHPSVCKDHCVALELWSCGGLPDHWDQSLLSRDYREGVPRTSLCVLL